MPTTMLLKNKVRSALRAVAKAPVVRRLVMHPAVYERLRAWPPFESIVAGGWHFPHPFDRRYRVETSGFVQPEQLESSPHEAGRKYAIYAGSQPSIIRTALNALPALPDCTFIDLGCGKGRPLLVASEYPFSSLVGFELTPSLVLQARKNAAVISRRFAQRAPIAIEQQDASLFPVPAGNAVIFLYNPFGAPVVARVAARIEAALATGGGTKFVIYYNPIHADCFDALPHLTRYFAANLPYAPEERGYGPDATDSVVIWQGGGAATAHRHADARIKLHESGLRAEIL
jgi:hypothetical protein